MCIRDSCYHLNHVFTQIPYALTVAGVSFVSFILAGLIHNVFVNLLIAVVLRTGAVLGARAVILCTGTYLTGQTIVGECLSLIHI